MEGHAHPQHLHSSVPLADVADRHFPAKDFNVSSTVSFSPIFGCSQSRAGCYLTLMDAGQTFCITNAGRTGSHVYLSSDELTINESLEQLFRKKHPWSAWLQARRSPEWREGSSQALQQALYGINEEILDLCQQHLNLFQQSLCMGRCFSPIQSHFSGALQNLVPDIN